MAASLMSPFSSLGSPTAAAISPETNRPLVVEVTANKQSDIALKTKAQKIDAYFDQYGLPLAGQGEVLAAAAEEHDLPWPLIAAVAMQESTGGKFACRANRFNAWGYGSCKGAKFQSFQQGATIVAQTISADRDATRHHYDGKSLDERLRVYNGRAVADYAESVHRIMDKIEDMPVTEGNA